MKHLNVGSGRQFKGTKQAQDLITHNAWHFLSTTSCDPADTTYKIVPLSPSHTFPTLFPKMLKSHCSFYSKQTKI